MEVKKKVNNLIPMMISNGVIQRHRSLFILVGDFARDQVANLHHMLSQARNRSRPSVLWCYHSELGFSSNKQRRAEKLKKQLRQGTKTKDMEDPFDMFLSSTDITYTYYKETENVLGRTFGMLVLQDFHALTPNIIARTMETVEGGGIICLLLKSISSLKQLISMSMDAHSMYQNTSFASDIAGRFNYRFLLSLATCKQCCVVDDELNILPISSHIYNIQKLNPDGTISDPLGKSTGKSVIDPDGSFAKQHSELQLLKTSLDETEFFGPLVKLACTLDQAKAYLKCANVLLSNKPNTTATLFAGRGRGKSATLGFVLAHAIVSSYSNIFITAPSPTNVITVFEFAIRALEALGYKRNIDFDVIESDLSTFITHSHGAQQLSSGTDRQSQKIITGIVVRSPPPNDTGLLDFASNITKSKKDPKAALSTTHHRQVITYIQPKDAHLLTNCDLLLIDEAAAIPLPYILQLMKGGNLARTSTSAGTTNEYIVFLSSTINGYEGSGRALSLQLIKTLREQTTNAMHYSSLSKKNKTGQKFENALGANAKIIQNRILEEITLTEPIRYGINDSVESWMNKLLCLDCVSHIPKLISPPQQRASDIVGSQGCGKHIPSSGLPHPSECTLYYVSRDTLFSYHDMSEHLLQQIMALYVSSYYKNTPNDLQTLADAPQHHLFVLLGPLTPGKAIPDILALAQIALEGNISDANYSGQMETRVATGQPIQSGGDLIPWAVSQQYLTRDFAQLTGGRIFRLAVHPDIQHLGYGSRLVDLIIQYYDGKLYNKLRADSDDDDDDDDSEQRDDASQTSKLLNINQQRKQEQKQNLNNMKAKDAKKSLLSEEISLLNRSSLPPLFVQLSQRRPEALHWLGVSFGLTPVLHRFFKKFSFYPLYIKQTANQSTGEYSTIMVRAQTENAIAQRIALERGIVLSNLWLTNLFTDFRAKFVSTLGFAYHDVPAIFVAEILSKFTTFYHQQTIQQQQQLLLEQRRNDELHAELDGDDYNKTSMSDSDAKKANDMDIPLPGRHNDHPDSRQKRADLVTGNELIDTNEFAASTISRQTLYELFTPFDLKRLDNYANNMIDYSLILNTIPHLARLYFLNKLSLDLINFQQAILIGVGLQNKTLNVIEKELDIGSVQALALFNKAIRRLTQCIRFVEEREVATTLAKERLAVKAQTAHLIPQQSTQSLAAEMQQAVEDLHKATDAKRNLQRNGAGMRYIGGNPDDETDMSNTYKEEKKTAVEGPKKRKTTSQPAANKKSRH